MLNQNNSGRAKGQVAQETIENKILDALEKSQVDYEKMSGGNMCNAEYWITTYVARALWKLCGDGTVYLEGNIPDTLECAGRRQGRSNASLENSQSRYDIVLYKKNEDPRAIIEIKNSLYSGKIKTGAIMKDVVRVCDSLNTAKFNFGVVGYAVSREGGKIKEGKTKLKDHAESIEDEAKSIAKEKGLKAEFRRKIKKGNDDEEEPAWLVGCIVIER